MSKELTINLDDELYTGLMKSVGEKNVSRFIESVLRSHLKNGSEIYDVIIPVAPKIHSPRLADRTLADRFKMEMTEETENGKL
jgi:predicted CopG family antitoxin